MIPSNLLSIASLCEVPLGSFVWSDKYPGHIGIVGNLFGNSSLVLFGQGKYTSDQRINFDSTFVFQAVPSNFLIDPTSGQTLHNQSVTPGSLIFSRGEMHVAVPSGENPSGYSPVHIGSAPTLSDTNNHCSFSKWKAIMLVDGMEISVFEHL